MTNEEAIVIFEEWIKRDSEMEYCDRLENIQLYKMAIKALEQEDILNEIRAEILDEAEYAYADFDRYKEDILHAEPDELPDDDFRYGLERAAEIINKYKTESEE